jgi:hypothetical protein
MIDRNVTSGRGVIVRAGILGLLTSAGVTAAGAPVTDQQNVVDSATFDAATVADVYRAQTFTVARDGLLSEIGFQAYKTSSSALNPTISVYHASTNSPSTAVPQSAFPLFNGTVPMSSFPTNSSSFAGEVPLTSFTLGGAAIPVKAGDVLTIGMSLNHPAANQPFWRSGADTYSGGRFFSKVGNGAWTPESYTINGVNQVLDTGFRTGVEEMNVGRFTPASDATATMQAGGAYLVSDGGTSINVQNTGSAGTNRRGILEFDATSVGAGADVRAATLTFDINAITTDGVTFPNVRVYAYGGDGLALPDDATQNSILVGTSQSITVTGQKLQMQLNPDALETILASSDYVGLLVVGSTDGRQTGFNTNESAPFGGSAPTLRVAFVPEPATAGILAAAAAGLLTRRRRS